MSILKEDFFIKKILVPLGLSFYSFSLAGYVFDVYRGKGIDEGKKSVAFRLTFRLPDKTLSDEEVDHAVAKVLKKLGEEAGIALRS